MSRPEPAVDPVSVPTTLRGIALVQDSGPAEPDVPDRVARTRRFPDLLRRKHRDLGTESERDLDVIEMVTDLTRLVSRFVQDFENTVHRPLDLTWAGFRILNSLWVFDGLEQQDIGRLSGSSRASVSAALNTLERRGFVSRKRALTDRRNVEVALTPQGMDSLRSVIAAQTKREQAWTAVLSDSEIQTLIKLLRRLVDQDTPPKPTASTDGDQPVE